MKSKKKFSFSDFMDRASKNAFRDGQSRNYIKKSNGERKVGRSF